MDLISVLFAPNVAYASLDSFLASVNTEILNPLIKLLFALAIAFFLFGVYEFIANQENDEKRTAGKMHMLYGVIGITIMMGVFVIMNMILATLNVKDITIDSQGNTNINLQPSSTNFQPIKQ